jgi:hypothetical protein
LKRERKLKRSDEVGEEKRQEVKEGKEGRRHAEEGGVN